MATPSYVRLSTELVSGLVVDMESGWGISGRDVQPYPENDVQATFVKSALRQGILEEATADEYEATHPDPTANLTEAERDAQNFVRAVEAAGKKLPTQELKVQQEVQQQAEKVRQFRETGGDDGAEVVRRNKERVEEQRARGLSGDTEGEVKEASDSPPAAETKTTGGKQTKDNK